MEKHAGDAQKSFEKEYRSTRAAWRMASDAVD
jgi:hypothetical protein